MASLSLKQQAAEAALQYIPKNSIIGVGTGSTVNCFIEALRLKRFSIEGAVASSIATAEKLTAINIPVIDLNTLDDLPIYIDGTDCIDAHLCMLKGGGGAMTREKIIAMVAKTFICIADETKYQEKLSSQQVPITLEVLPMARSYVARQVVKLGGTPIYRQGFITDNGNVILDVFNLALFNPVMMEQTLNNITGVVENGLFGVRKADILLLSGKSGVKTLRAAL